MTIAEMGWIHCTSALEHPVRTSFGAMHQRHALLVVVTTDDGAVGIGETWTNFPSWVSRERIATLEEGVRPLVRGRRVDDIRSFTLGLLRELEPIARQWGAWGPLFQAVSGLDIALWDALGHREGCAVSQLLAEGPVASSVKVYASGLGPVDPVATAMPLSDAGVNAFKLKVGFDPAVDQRNLAAMREAFPDALLAVDANQAWSLDEALAFRTQLERYGCAWVEEPLPVEDLDGLTQLAPRLGCPIALGENTYGRAQLHSLVQRGVVGILQPDVAKNGGISSALHAYELAAAHELTVVPHYLGGAVGQVASVHLVAARDPDGMLEFDANPNPLREDLVAGTSPWEGRITVPDGPGLGVEVDLEVMQRLLSATSSVGLPRELNVALTDPGAARDE